MVATGHDEATPTPSLPSTPGLPHTDRYAGSSPRGSRAGDEYSPRVAAAPTPPQLHTQRPSQEQGVNAETWVMSPKYWQYPPTARRGRHRTTGAGASRRGPSKRQQERASHFLQWLFLQLDLVLNVDPAINADLKSVFLTVPSLQWRCRMRSLATSALLW